uniref:Splicing factor 3a subunit 1 n=1 Tax=Myotis myotis TaxID=51298 RepID=A0A7J7S348_MYOMY|nr:splicing factor 3a subunit 1 [Myotis myotis]
MPAGPVQAVPPPPPVATEPKQPTEEDASSKEDSTPSKPVVGIIYPPPEVRNIVDKTASFVARNGPEFEARIRQNEINNPKFNFLNPNDPYHAYYRHKVSEFKEGKAQEPSAAIPKVMQQQQQATQQQLPQKVGALIQERYEKFGESEEVEMEVESDEEDEKQEKTEEPPSQLDQDTQVQDMDEGSDDEEEGQKVPPPPETPMPPPLPPTPDQVIVRKDYDPKASKPLPPAPAPDEYLVSPITGEKIPASKMQEHMRIGLLDPRWLEQRDRSIREKQSDDEVYAPGLDIESSLKQLAERRTDIFGVEETAIGKKIGEEEIQKPEEKVTWDGHSGSMARTQQAAQANITLQEQIEAIHKAKGLVPEDDTKEKIGPSKPNEIPQQPPPPSSATNIPSSAPPITSVPRPPAMPPPVRTTVVSAVPVMPRPPMASVVRLPPGSVIAPMPPIIHAPRINVVPMPPSAPPIMAPRPPPMIVPTAFVPAPPVAPVPAPAPMPPVHPPPPMEDEPASKKLKTEDSLMPEEEFLRRNKGPVSIKVQVPNMQDKTEWKLNGQVLVFTLPLTDQVSVIKVKIHEATGMPAGKQKLQYEGIFIKDSNSLAYYNMANGAVIHLALKERGGRKK